MNVCSTGTLHSKYHLVKSFTNSLVIIRMVVLYLLDFDMVYSVLSNRWNKYSRGLFYTQVTYNIRYGVRDYFSFTKRGLSLRLL